MEDASGNWQQKNPLKVIAMVEVNDDEDPKGTGGGGEQKGREKQTEVKHYKWRISKKAKG